MILDVLKNMTSVSYVSKTKLVRPEQQEEKMFGALRSAHSTCMNLALTHVLSVTVVMATRGTRQ